MPLRRDASTTGPARLPAFPPLGDGDTTHRPRFTHEAAATVGLAEVAATDEELIVDDRSGLSPAEEVENRLSRRLVDATMPVSHLQMRGLLRGR